MERQRRSDRRFKNPGQASQLLNLPELGVIPSAQADPSPLKGLLERGRTHFLRLRPLGLQEGEHQDAITTANLGDRTSPIAESYRATIASLLFANSSRAPSIIVITSATQGEGKTTAVANLGLALSELGRRVLLIDGDLRRPKLHKLFGIENKRGLGDLLDGGMHKAEASPESLITKTEVTNLSLITAGKKLAAPLPLLFSSRLPEFLAQYRKQFDAILIDTPPVHLFSDARFLGRLSDGVVLVLRSNVNPPEVVLPVCRRLNEDGIPLLGTILNDWKAGDVSYESYYYSQADVVV